MANSTFHLQSGKFCKVQTTSFMMGCMGTGEGEAKSVEGQVQQLLQEAQDPDRLCRLFVGWAPWL